MILDVVKIRLDGDWCATVDLTVGIRDEAVVVGFLNPFVDDGAGPGACHIGTEDGHLISEGALASTVAPCFGEEDGNRVAV